MNIEKVEVVNILGQTISGKSFSKGTNNLITIETNALPSAVYFVRLTINGITDTKKVVVVH